MPVNEVCGSENHSAFLGPLPHLKIPSQMPPFVFNANQETERTAEVTIADGKGEWIYTYTTPPVKIIYANGRLNDNIKARKYCSKLE